VALWAVLAWALFRYWPVSAENESKEAAPEVTPEPAL